MNKRLISLALGLLAGTVAVAEAQVASARKCATGEAVGYIGISGISCNCTIGGVQTGHEWSFRTEPKITSLEMDSPAGKLLKPGDVITSVNGKLITTREGARELAEIHPGEAVVLTVRRNGQMLRYAMTAQAVCPDDSRLLGYYAPEVPPAVAPPAIAGGVPSPTPPPGATPPEAAAPVIAPRAYEYARPRVPPALPLSSRVTFGMGLSCSNCSMTYGNNSSTWVFSRPPEIYSIEPGGPAAKAGLQRGDIITHINGKRIDASEGGRTFANVRPGEWVQFTAVRGNRSGTYHVRAAARVALAQPTPAPDLEQSSRALDEANRSLQLLQRSQADQLARLQVEMRHSQRMQEEDLRNAQQRMLREEQEHRQRLDDLMRHMTMANARMRAALADSARAVCTVTPAMAATIAAGKASRTLRYSGTLAGTDIEVRGANPVTVSETPDEVVITTGATVVRVQKKK